MEVLRYGVMIVKMYGLIVIILYQGKKYIILIPILEVKSNVSLIVIVCFIVNLIVIVCWEG